MKFYLVVLIACFLLGTALGVSPMASPMPGKGMPSAAHHKRAVASSIIDAAAAAPKAEPSLAHKLAKRGGYG